MRIAIIGVGYVGLVAGACLADTGNVVICTDKDSEKIKLLQKGTIPIYEPGLEEIVKSNIIKNRLYFTHDLDYSVKSSDICFIAVGTPQDKDGSADLSYILEAAKQIASAMDSYKLIVNKSTAPVGTIEKIAKIIQENTPYPFDIVSNPEFLRQGSALDDFLSPDRIIIGAASKNAQDTMRRIYAPFAKNENKIIFTDIKSAEMTKYATNSFLAIKISFMNEIANLCEKLGADVKEVKKGMASDLRIGDKFLNAGVGFGGSCFPKDLRALAKLGKNNDCPISLAQAAIEANEKQKKLFVKKIIDHFRGNVKGKTFAIWGLSFKPNTDDMREAPSIVIIEELLKYGAKIQAYDPKASQNAKKIFEDKITYSKSSYAALEGACALVILSEWREFAHPNFKKIKTMLKGPVIFDGRNQYSSQYLENLGFTYISVGKAAQKEGYNYYI